MPVVDSWALILGIIAVVTISIGSISAVFQTSVKRLLAYSSVAHAGYMLIILLSDINNTGADLLFYSLAYAISSLVAFTIIIHVENKAGSDNVDAFNGLAKVNPLLSLLLTVSLISLAGIPLTGGFFAKFNILKVSYNSGFYFIVLGAIVNAIIGIYYYFKVIIAIYFKPSSDTKAQPILLGPLNLFLLVVAAILIVQLGVYPEWVYFLF
jgi:NADH-quinone oxidoreductase subunit N